MLMLRLSALILQLVFANMGWLVAHRSDGYGPEFSSQKTNESSRLCFSCILDVDCDEGPTSFTRFYSISPS